MKLNKRLILTIIMVVILIIIVTLDVFSKRAYNAPISKDEFCLGTLCKISVYDKVNEKVLDRAYDKIRGIESKITVNNADTSEIIELNNAAGKHAVKISKDTLKILKKGIYYSQLSQGKFDITIGAVSKLWNIGTNKEAIPNQMDLQNALKHVDYRALQIDESSNTAMLKKEGTKIDLGGLAKGYIADEVAIVLANNDVKNALINLGGNILTMGSNPNRDHWNVYIQDPYATRGSILGSVQIKNNSNKSVVTSGTYERFFECKGKRYHHIMNSKTGYPVENELLSVTIIADKSSNADGMSNCVFQFGLKGGMDLVRKVRNIDAVFITKDKKIYITDGLKCNFTLTNNEYTLIAN
ncbi:MULTISPECIES: FAD:protein FMN transferase [Clostridium]|uniref:FAD:protein FMN transferase n=1 Tax=Clostridium TaxID=1485 RepID=UPI000DFC210A|nr:FAD:protein FMN transferase [Clostridium sporogenes]MCW6085042.1 FAD:protein FMN transferase [Clostridium sporogenes]STC73503.1 ApbE family protein [Clostridium botulinum]